MTKVVAIMSEPLVAQLDEDVTLAQARGMTPETRYAKSGEVNIADQQQSLREVPGEWRVFARRGECETD